MPNPGLPGVPNLRGVPKKLPGVPNPRDFLECPTPIAICFCPRKVQEALASANSREANRAILSRGVSVHFEAIRNKTRHKEARRHKLMFIWPFLPREASACTKHCRAQNSSKAISVLGGGFGRGGGLRNLWLKVGMIEEKILSLGPLKQFVVIISNDSLGLSLGSNSRPPKMCGLPKPPE